MEMSLICTDRHELICPKFDTSYKQFGCFFSELSLVSKLLQEGHRDIEKIFDFFGSDPEGT